MPDQLLKKGSMEVKYVETLVGKFMLPQQEKEGWTALRHAPVQIVRHESENGIHMETIHLGTITNIFLEHLVGV